MTRGHALEVGLTVFAGGVHVGGEGKGERPTREICRLLVMPFAEMGNTERGFRM